MKVRCPVVLCGWEGKTHDFWKHIPLYKERMGDIVDYGMKRGESHERWAKYYFPQIWDNPDLDEKAKWTNIVVAYVEQMKRLGRKKQKPPSPNGSDKIEMRDGKVFMNGQEYTPEEFQKIMPGIKVPPQDNHPHPVRDITGELLIDGITVDEYRKMHAEPGIRRANK